MSFHGASWWIDACPRARFAGTHSRGAGALRHNGGRGVGRSHHSHPDDGSRTSPTGPPVSETRIFCCCRCGSAAAISGAVSASSTAKPRPTRTTTKATRNRGEGWRLWGGDKHSHQQETYSFAIVVLLDSSRSHPVHSLCFERASPGELLCKVFRAVLGALCLSQAPPPFCCSKTRTPPHTERVLFVVCAEPARARGWH